MKHENAVLKAVMQTEKGAALQEKQNRYMVRVDRAATKPEIKKAVEDFFNVTVGEVIHPMLDNHYIGWILLETKNGEERKELKPGEEPVAQFFAAEDDEIVAAYAWCNLHGLWMA